MQFSVAVAIISLVTPLIAAAPLGSTVRVQLNGLSELAIQREIPINNKATPFPGKFTDGFITNFNGNKGITCQAYSDPAATVKVGGRFGANSVVFNGGKEVKVAVIKCKSN